MATLTLDTIKQAPMKATVAATILALSTPVFANQSGAGGISKVMDANKDSGFISSKGGDGVDQSMGRLYDIVRYIAVIIGLFLSIGGLMSVSKAAKTEGQKSQMPGWITFAIGGLMTVVGTLMFVIGNSARNLATGN